MKRDTGALEICYYHIHLHQITHLRLRPCLKG